MTPLVLLILLAGGSKPDPGVLHVIGRFATAQATPVAADRALTCAHVVEPRPFEAGVNLYPAVWSDDSGGEGVVRPLATLAVVDLALVAGTFARWYELADAAPVPGTRVHFVGYDWSNKKRAYEPKRIDTKVVRVMAGHVVLEEAGEGGSSGSPIIDGQGRVVAINCDGHTMRSLEEVGRAVGTWGPWVRELLARPEPEP